MHGLLITVIVNILSLNRPLLISCIKKALIWALKGTVAKMPIYRASLPKKEKLSLLTHPHVVPNPFFFRTEVMIFLIKVEPHIVESLIWHALLLCTVSGNISVALLSMTDQKALGFHLNLCSEDEWSSYGFGTTSINYRIFVFGWTIP